MGEEQDVHPAGEQEIERSEELGELLGKDDVAIAIPEILGAGLVGALANVLD